ncbi:MAG: aldo/keto reductase [Dehalococcoidales bacterium]|nr:aldo/keto reductase [Dehalococcoidales bacterium]
MEKFRLGKTDLMVTKIGFGGIPIQRLTEEGAVQVVRRCIDLGINFIDTANGYTTSEERIGKAIKGQRENLIIATKTGGRDAKTAQEHLDLSLKRLQTDYIDIYQFHGVSTPEHMKAVFEGGLYEVAEKAKKAGKIRHISVTSHSMDMSKELVKTDKFETLMFPFNFITNEPMEELIPLCRQHDVGFIAMKPMAGGMLENAAVAFKYLFKIPDVLPLVGIEKVEEIDEIAALAEGPQEMTEAEKAQMQALVDELGKIFCRRCDYCQPCQQGIRISGVLTSRSFFKRMPPERFFGEMMTPTIAKAAECIQCGECESRCPYNLPIIEMLAEHVEWFNEEKRKFEAGKV